MKKINQTLLELIAGILIFSAAAELIGLVFVSGKGFFSLGLLIGSVVAIGMSVHMYIVLDNGLDLPEKDAKRYVTSGYIKRTAVVALVFGLTVYYNIGHVVAMFIGMMGLKAGAYLQPFVHRLFEKFNDRINVKDVDSN